MHMTATQRLPRPHRVTSAPAVKASASRLRLATQQTVERTHSARERVIRQCVIGHRAEWVCASASATLMSDLMMGVSITVQTINNRVYGIQHSDNNIAETRNTFAKRFRVATIEFLLLALLQKLLVFDFKRFFRCLSLILSCLSAVFQLLHLSNTFQEKSFLQVLKLTSRNFV